MTVALPVGGCSMECEYAHNINFDRFRFCWPLWLSSSLHSTAQLLIILAKQMQTSSAQNWHWIVVRSKNEGNFGRHFSVMLKIDSKKLNKNKIFFIFNRNVYRIQINPWYHIRWNGCKYRHVTFTGQEMADETGWNAEEKNRVKEFWIG